MNKLRKLIRLVIIMSLAANLVGCNSIFNTVENQSATECEETTTYTEEITDQESGKISSDLNVIVQSLNNRDIENIRTLFDDATLQEITAFEKRMKYVFDMVDDKVIKVEECETYKTKAFEVALSDWYGVYVSYDIYTETNKYTLDISYRFNKNINVADTGVYSIEISDLEREHMYYEYGNSITHKIPGVFSTEIETIEYNSNELWTYYSQRDEIVPIMASAAAVELSRAGIEKIHVENLEVNDEGWMSITLVDEMNFKYLVKTDEYGYIEFIFENDADGREVFCRL